MHDVKDNVIIRYEARSSDIKFRGIGFTKERLKKIKKALHALHTLEIMATNIYRFHIGNDKDEVTRELIAAMLNEMTHIQEFQTKLLEYGFRPTLFRAMYWIVGFVIGFASRIFGKKTILKTGIWVETRAVNHYQEFLRDVEWDEESRVVVERAMLDEKHHIETWSRLLLNYAL